MGHTTPIETFLNQHKSQLLSLAVPEIYWEPLYRKLLTETFDAGKSFQLVKIEYDDEEKSPNEPLWGLQAIRDLDNKDPENIYLIDHAWTYQITQARNQLENFESLRIRLANILGLDSTLSSVELIDLIFENMWKINSNYRIKRNLESTEQNQIWYIMDEIGCAVQHSDIPNCRILPFFYLNDGASYSLLFLQENVKQDDLIYRDFAEGIKDYQTRKAALYPWIPTSFDEFPIDVGIPDECYFLSGHISEILPNLSTTNKLITKKEKYLCYTQYDLIEKHLTDSRFQLTENSEEADILWYTEHFRDFKKLSDETPQKFINQFPYEYVVTIKDLLSLTCRRRYKNNTEIPYSWLPITYNLVTEIGNFANYFLQCEKEQNKENNYWIIKPYNLARGMDIHITNNLNYIMRLPATGPKIAQKYLANSVLFYRPECEGKVKFDLRYVILLKSVKPLEISVYKNFFLRFSNKPFELRNFDDYEKHFTVMNYTENAELKHLKCEEFKVEWQKQYENYDWDKVEEKILKMIKEIFQCATSVPPPCGIAENSQSRALYAADLMLDWVDDKKIQPKILEINYMPDCERACKYYPEFFNDIFNLLFLNNEKVNTFYNLANY